MLDGIVARSEEETDRFEISHDRFYGLRFRLVWKSFFESCGRESDEPAGAKREQSRVGETGIEADHFRWTPRLVGKSAHVIFRS